MSGIARIVKECHSAGILLTILCADIQFCGCYSEEPVSYTHLTLPTILRV